MTQFFMRPGWRLFGSALVSFALANLVVTFTAVMTISAYLPMNLHSRLAAVLSSWVTNWLPLNRWCLVILFAAGMEFWWRRGPTLTAVNRGEPLALAINVHAPPFQSNRQIAQAWCARFAFWWLVHATTATIAMGGMSVWVQGKDWSAWTAAPHIFFLGWMFPSLYVAICVGVATSQTVWEKYNREDRPFDFRFSHLIGPHWMPTLGLGKHSRFSKDWLIVNRTKSGPSVMWWVRSFWWNLHYTWIVGFGKLGFVASLAIGAYYLIGNLFSEVPGVPFASIGGVGWGFASLALSFQLIPLALILAPVSLAILCGALLLRVFWKVDFKGLVYSEGEVYGGMLHDAFGDLPAGSFVMGGHKRNRFGKTVSSWHCDWMRVSTFIIESEMAWFGYPNAKLNEGQIDQYIIIADLGSEGQMVVAQLGATSKGRAQRMRDKLQQEFIELRPAAMKHLSQSLKRPPAPPAPRPHVVSGVASVAV